MSGLPKTLPVSESVLNANPPTGTKKRCSKCGEEKKFDEFYKDRREGREYYARCKKCHNLAASKWRKEHPEVCNQHAIAFRERNPEKFSKIQAKYRNKVKSTGKGKLRYTIASLVWHSIKKGGKAGRAWEALVGYSLEDLQQNMEKKFKKGMSWNNYGRKGWHIDHKIPMTAFNYSTPQDIDFKKCWALGNLQPMWWEENMKKSNKLDRPFQPSLLLQETRSQVAEMSL